MLLSFGDGKYIYLKDLMALILYHYAPLLKIDAVIEEIWFIFASRA